MAHILPNRSDRFFCRSNLSWFLNWFWIYFGYGKLKYIWCFEFIFCWYKTTLSVYERIMTN
jgi:hypothetical protein